MDKVNNPEVSPNDEEQAYEDALQEVEGQADEGTDIEADGEQSQEDSQQAEEVIAEPTKGYIPEKQYKDLQADYTRKSQLISQYERLFSDPRVRQAVEGTLQPGQPQQGIPQQQQQPEEPPDFANMSERDRALYIIDQRIKGQVTGVQQQTEQRLEQLQRQFTQLQNMTQPFIQNLAQRQVDEFLAKYPEAAAHEQEIAQIMNQHNMPMEKAWKFLNSDTAKDAAKQEVYKEIDTKRKANLQKPNTKTSIPQIRKGMSLKEIAEISAKQKGIDW